MMKNTLLQESKCAFTDLRKQMPLFANAIAEKKHAVNGFDEYLDFYQLPEAKHNLKVIAGTSEDQATAIIAWQPKQSLGTAVVVHGYMDHIGLYGHLIRYLLTQHLTVVCLDLKGHGLSSGKTCSIKSFQEYVDQVDELLGLCISRFEGPIHGIGQSMGGAVLMKHCLNHQNHQLYSFDSLNLLAPLLHPLAWQKNRWLYLLSRCFVKTIKRAYRASSWDQAFLDFLRYQDPFQPTRVPIDWIGAMDHWINEFKQSPKSDYPIHIIQGDNDNTLDWAYNLTQFEQTFGTMTKTIIARGNHHLVNESLPLRSTIFSNLKLN
jgi:alpha-beta hydrolase superfamily lysophospholipase